MASRHPLPSSSGIVGIIILFFSVCYNREDIVKMDWSGSGDVFSNCIATIGVSSDALEMHRAASLLVSYGYGYSL